MRADRAFASLVVAALLALALPAGMAARFLPMVAQELSGSAAHHTGGAIGAACVRLFALLPGGAPAAGLFVATLLVVTVTRGARVAWAQWRNGRRLAAAIARARRPLPPALARRIRCCGLRGRVDLVDGRRPVALTYGWLAPRICLTTGLVALLHGDELDAVLRHERHHLAHRDPLRLLCARALAAGACFVPTLRDVQTHGLTLLELAADDAAVAPPHGPGALARALYALLRHEQPAPAAGDGQTGGSTGARGAGRRHHTGPPDGGGAAPLELSRAGKPAGAAIGFHPQPTAVLAARIDHLVDPQGPLPVTWSPARAAVTAAILLACLCLLLYL